MDKETREILMNVLAKIEETEKSFAALASIIREEMDERRRKLDLLLDLLKEKREEDKL